MFPRFKGLMTLFAILCVAAIAGGSAYFYFGEKASDEKSISNKTEGTNNTGGVIADNILENYEFGNDKDLNETYTYYFFPSTLYMTDDFFDSDTMPETVFGYNEVILDDNGDPVLDSNNQPQYKIVQDNITGINNHLSYHDYLTKYLNYESESYLNSNPLALSMDDHGNQTPYSYSNKGTSSDKDSANGNVYTYGISVNGDDSHVQGYSTSMKDPYILNNTELSSELLLNNVKFSNYEKGSEESYNNFYYLKKDFNTTIKYADEVLSPIYYEENSENKTYDISLGLDDKKIELINAYADYYQHGSNSRLNSNSLTVTSDDGMIRYKGTSYIQGTFRDHSPFYNNTSNHELQCFSLAEIEESPRLGTWFGTNSRGKTIVFTFLNNRRGYFYDFDGYEINEFDYSVSDSDGSKNISFKTDRSWSHPISLSGTLQLNTSDPTIQMVNRAQYRNDRFGFWTAFYDWDNPKNSNSYIQNSASRYLPIKITVNGNLTPDDMAKVIPTLSASMFDNNMWADFTANVWTYVPYTYNSESEQYDFDYKELYTKGTDGFTAKDITYIFDIMQNPSKYADKDGNIRLFPVFSNGKNAGGDKANGGSDAIQASFEYNDGFEPTINNVINPKSTKMTYSSVVYNFYDYEVNYAVLKNVEITENKFTSLKIRMDTTNSPHNWTGNWTDIYSFNFTQLNDLISDYGEGLYTFYLFVGGRATNTNRGSTPFNGDDLVSRITDYSGSGNELYKKYLLPLSDSSNTDIVVNGASSNRYVYNTKDGIGEQARPVALAVEKVTNLRLVSDIPIAEDENGEPKDEQNWTAIDNSIKQGLLNAKNFTIADEVYSIKEDIYNSDTINLPNDGTRIDSNNPYIYVIQNADFRFVNNLYFQIRFSNDYINNAMNVTTDYSRIKGKKPDKYVAYSINNQVLKFKFQDSDDGDVFIENATAGSGTDVRQGFKLKDYNARGIYDILLISHETAGYIGTWTGIVGSDNIELVINDDGTLLYNDKPYTYTVDKNTIKAVDESESYQLEIIYDETTKSLNVTWKDLEGHTYNGKLTDFVYKQQYYMYVNRHTNSFIKLFKGNPGTFEFQAEGTNEATNNFVSHKLPIEVSEEEKKDPAKDPTRNENSSLIWNGQTYLGEYLSTSTTGLSYGAKVNGEETFLSNNESFIDAIKRTIGVTPGLDNIYPIYDCVTGQQIAYYNSGVGRLFTSFGSGDGVSSDLDLFTIMKNYVLYIGEPVSRVI